MKKIIVGTWKMNLDLEASITLANNYIQNDSDGITVAVAPSLISIKSVLDIISPKNIAVVAQDCSIKNGFGAFTGEVSATMLKQMGVFGVIIGHSERRIELNESNIVVNQKIKNVLSNEMKAIVCIGEDLNTRDNGETSNFVREQFLQSLDGITADQLNNLIIAYEPVWAISSAAIKRIPKEEEIVEVMNNIRKLTKEKYGQEGENIKLLYGGSVGPDNIESYNKIDAINGYLVGSSSLDAHKFDLIVKSN